MIIEIQCLPNPPGTAERRYAHVEAAIAVVQASGIKYEVGALGTTIEGEPDDAWRVARAAHEACLRAGATSVVTVIKVAETASAANRVGIDDLVGKFRT